MKHELAYIKKNLQMFIIFKDNDFYRTHSSAIFQKFLAVMYGDA